MGCFYQNFKDVVKMRKLFLIFTFSAYLINNYLDRYTGFKAMFMSFLHIFPVFFLIAVEPDLGTSLVIILIYGMLLFLNKLEWKCIATVFFTIAALIPISYKFLLIIRHHLPYK